MTQLTDRPGIDDLTSDMLDRLYAERDRFRTELDALKSIGRTYCPACGRGDCSPTADQWYEQQQRAERAEATLTAVADHLRYVLNYDGPGHCHLVPGRWDADGSHCDHCTRLAAARAVLDQHGQTPKETT